MRSISFSNVLVFGASFISFISAAPLTVSERSATCSTGQIYYPEGSCTSGFVGCNSNPDLCTGEKRYFSECPGGTGIFMNCNDFKGCTLNRNICDPIPTPAYKRQASETPVPTTFCPFGQEYFRPGDCSSGFVGCNSNPDFCSGPKRFVGTCPGGTGEWYECASSGFVGCTFRTNICDAHTLPRPNPPTIDSPPTEGDESGSTSTVGKCPAGTSFIPQNYCPSGFIGCVDAARYEGFCAGPKRFFNDCPAGSGLVFRSCVTGFAGCTSDITIC
ncbi:hypothetical protein M501DRAFT_994068 [Patellaria atrata CBS 101060]|uniref:Uncharacterized protein n=1 Tax=Patellaria atrata CBS 101060 TaxID=1346257 RepID=A0A9P4SIM8_9PEZI|nr:hypothetical protein M501DRAFT_994068 [Patellaria atrata CBS 101060]